MILDSLQAWITQTIAGNPPAGIEQAEQGLTASTFVVLKLTGRDPHNVLDGDDTSTLFTDEIDIDCKAPTPLQSMALAEAVFAAIRNLTGTVGDRDIKAVDVEPDWLSSYDSPKAGENRGRHVTTVPVVVHHQSN